MKRFIETTAEKLGEEPSITPTKWWLDTLRPINEKPGCIAVQTEADKDPNDFIKVNEMRLLFNDQAEYYAVCVDCFNAHHDKQWCGSSRSPNWKEKSEEYLKKHFRTKSWCEFCDPVFGNGGWT